jgi:hypothetical protein
MERQKLYPGRKNQCQAGDLYAHLDRDPLQSAAQGEIPRTASGWKPAIVAIMRKLLATANVLPRDNRSWAPDLPASAT